MLVDLELISLINDSRAMKNIGFFLTFFLTFFFHHLHVSVLFLCAGQSGLPSVPVHCDREPRRHALFLSPSRRGRSGLAAASGATGQHVGARGHV